MLAGLLILFAAACGDDASSHGDAAAQPAVEPSPAAPAAPADAAAPASRPNVIVIVMDTTRADRCSFLGYERPTTPYLVRLAKSGVAYSNCWSPAPWTAPSHASLFTGLRPEHHGLLRENRPFLAEASVTLAERFRAAGYRTCGISNNPNVSVHRGLNQGFERFDERWAENVTGSTDPAVSPLAPIAAFPDCDEGHKLALAWTHKRVDAGERFFLFVNDTEPHLPYRPAPDLRDTFLRHPEPAEDLAWARDFAYPQPMEHCLGVRAVPPDRLALLSDLYDGEIATLDRKLGLFIDELRRMGALDDTILVVLGDHGENLGEHGLLDHTLSLHKTLLHVPLLIVAPGRMRPGRVSDLVRVEDVAPTLLALTGLPGDTTMDGESLLEGLAGRHTWAALDRLEDAQLQSLRDIYPRIDLSRALIGMRSYADEQLHLISARNGTEELYEHAVDPLEQHDLAPGGDPRLPAARERLREAYPSHKR